MIQIAAFVQSQYLNNLFFENKMPQIVFNKIPIPRDDNNEGFYNLRKKMLDQKISINTYDLIKNNKIDFSIHFFYDFTKLNNLTGIKAKKKYCVLPEPEEIAKFNVKKNLKKNFDKVFTFFDDDIDSKKFFGLKYPVPIKNFIINGFKNRKKLVCILSSNKNLSKYSLNSGYSERVKLIKWFEKYKNNDLSLYGIGWSSFFSSNYFFNRYLSKFLKYFYRRRLKVYKGVAYSKKKIYSSHKFSICYENVLGLNGYFCELIFDSFNSGCVPVYWGCQNVTKYIPKNCYIDRRNFSNNFALYSFLKNMKESSFLEYQKNIKIFLNSKRAKLFSHENFTRVIINHIKKDFKKNEKC